VKGLISRASPCHRRRDQGDVGIQEPDARDLADEAGPLEVCVKESLVKRGDLLASFEVRPIEPDEITVLSERSGIDLATARVRGVYQLLIQGADGSLVRRWHGWW
jgi:hypothetical protein